MERQMAGGPAGPPTFAFLLLKTQKKLFTTLEKICSYLVEPVGAHSVHTPT